MVGMTKNPWKYRNDRRSHTATRTTGSGQAESPWVPCWKASNWVLFFRGALLLIISTSEPFVLIPGSNTKAGNTPYGTATGTAA